MISVSVSIFIYVSISNIYSYIYLHVLQETLKEKRILNTVSVQIHLGYPGKAS